MQFRTDLYKPQMNIPMNHIKVDECDLQLCQNSNDFDGTRQYNQITKNLLILKKLDYINEKLEVTPAGLKYMTKNDNEILHFLHGSNPSLKSGETSLVKGTMFEQFPFGNIDMYQNTKKLSLENVFNRNTNILKLQNVYDNLDKFNEEEDHNEICFNKKAEDELIHTSTEYSKIDPFNPFR